MDRSESANGTTSVVAVGASAGGLEAFTRLLESLPADPGFSIVLVMHLSPSRESDLAAILDRKTRMAVVQAEDGMLLEGDHVYVIPPSVEMRIIGGSIQLSPRQDTDTPSPAVDILFESLADQFGHRAIGVILSGSASDGAKGVMSVKANGGIVLVQDPSTAAHTGMPDAAIATNVADAVLPVEGIASELIRLAAHPYVVEPDESDDSTPSDLSPEDESALTSIIGSVRRVGGLDLTHYKRPTLIRRIGRRVAVTRAADLAGYADSLDADPQEVDALLNDVLIRVTSFFRDPQAFEDLKQEALPSILARKADGSPIRVWVPGCATGQEAYSIAMLLHESLEAAASPAPVQIFASDLREDDLVVARRATYPTDIAEEVGSERLERFFVAADGGYQLSKAIREMCVFARHDVTRDPPFARLDLVSCRNLLIYLGPVLQKRLLGRLHYALVPDGFLFVGGSEGTGATPGLFKRTSHKGIAQRMPGESPRFTSDEYGPDFSRAPIVGPVGPYVADTGTERWQDSERQLDAMLLDKYAPAAVLVDDDLRVRQVRGAAGDYLRLNPGDATLRLGAMLPIGLGSAVEAAVDEVRSTRRPTTREGIMERPGTGRATVTVTVAPMLLDDAPEGFAVTFDEASQASGDGAETPDEPTEADYVRQELAAAIERIRTLKEGRDTANESLQAANEEILSSNEELQSMNEELETAKEELQSSNEELTTLNDELGVRNAELARSNDDLNNLLTSASIAMLVLDADMSIRSFTQEAGRSFNLIDSDIGRLVTDIRWNLAIDDLTDLLETVRQTGIPIDREIIDDADRWLNMTIRPYTTQDSQIEGTVITLADIDTLRRSQTILERAGDLNSAIITIGSQLGASGSKDAARDALDAFVETMTATRADLLAWDEGRWDPVATSTAGSTSEPMSDSESPRADALSWEVRADSLATTETLANGDARLSIPLSSSMGSVIGLLRFELHGSRLPLDEQEADFCARVASYMALFMERRHHQRLLDAEVRERTDELRQALRQLETASGVKNAFLANMNHELRTPLNSIIGFSAILLDGSAGPVNEEQERQLEMIQKSGKHLLSIVSDLLDMEIITAGAMPTSLAKFRLGDTISSIGELLRSLAEAKGLELSLPGAEVDLVVRSDEQKIRQILLNLVNNAIKFTDEGRVKVDLTCEGRTCWVDVIDTGTGLTPEELVTVFEEFRQVEPEEGRLVEGTGLGLSISASLARLLGGEVTATSEPGVGSKFTLAMPVDFDT